MSFLKRFFTPDKTWVSGIVGMASGIAFASYYTGHHDRAFYVSLIAINAV
jgi:hypothetical protein